LKKAYGSVIIMIPFPQFWRNSKKEKL
jgi:hypothetical protein